MEEILHIELHNDTLYDSVVAIDLDWDKLKSSNVVVLRLPMTLDDFSLFPKSIFQLQLLTVSGKKQQLSARRGI